jgi:ubiquinone/menaquinone biosynthesis C-methylase UbiE
MLRDRRVTNVVRYVLDEWLPPVVRESRLLNRALARAFFGTTFDLDFKEKAFAMSPAEIAGAYERLAAGADRYRASDTTRGQAEAIVRHTVGPRVLEVGCGNGDLTELLARAGHRVLPCDVATHSLRAVRERIETAALAAAPLPPVCAGLPRLPFADESFDTVVCAHTLEHIPDIHESARELRRITRRRLIIVVPRQRYYRYTIDYHLHFFPSAAPLLALFGIPDAQVTSVDGDWLYVGTRHD